MRIERIELVTLKRIERIEKTDWMDLTLTEEADWTQVHNTKSVLLEKDLSTQHYQLLNVPH